MQQEVYENVMHLRPDVLNFLTGLYNMSTKFEDEALAGSSEELMRTLEDVVTAGKPSFTHKLLLAGAPFGDAFDRASKQHKWRSLRVLLEHLTRRESAVDCNDLTGETTVVYKFRPVSPLVTKGLLAVALRVAARVNETSVVKDLLNAGAGVRVGGALHVAAANDSLSSASLIVRDAPGSSAVHEVDLSGRTPLDVSATGGYTKMTVLLLEAGANVNAKHGVNGHTPLYRAVKEGWWGVVSVLLAQPGIDVNVACGLFQETALHLAPRSSLVLTRALLKRGADPNARSSDMTSPLHIAAVGKTPSVAMVIRELIKAGSDPNATCASGRSPLHLAAGVANPEAVSLLLWPGGADESTRDHGGTTAAQMVGNLVMPSKVNKDGVDRVKSLLKQAPVERMWRRKLPLFLCRWWVRGSETRLVTFQQQPKRLRVTTAPINGGAGIDSPAFGTTIWVFRDTTPEIFRCIVRFL